MKNAILAGLSAAATALSGALAQHQAPAPAVKEAMAKVAWLTGEWEGEGWRAAPDGEVHRFNVRETVEPKLGGLILLVEGRGWSEPAEGVRIDGHHAIGVFSYDAQARRYHFDAFVQEGYQTRSTPDVGDNHYSWSHPAGPGAEMRYTVQLTEDGAWLETGDYCREEECRQTFEMRLTRVD